MHLDPKRLRQEALQALRCSSFDLDDSLPSDSLVGTELTLYSLAQIRLHSLVTEEGLVRRSSEFESAIAGGEKSAVRLFCESKSRNSR